MSLDRAFPVTSPHLQRYLLEIYASDIPLVQIVQMLLHTCTLSLVLGAHPALLAADAADSVGPCHLHYLLASARQSPGRNPLCQRRAKEQDKPPTPQFCFRALLVSYSTAYRHPVPCNLAFSRATIDIAPPIAAHGRCFVHFYPARLAWRMRFARDPRPPRQGSGKYGTRNCLLGLPSFHTMPIFPTATLLHARTTSTPPT